MMIAAYFDVDNTLIKGTTSSIAVKYMIEKGVLKKTIVFKSMYFSLLHRLNLMNYEQMLKEVVRLFDGRREEEIKELTKDIFENAITPMIFKEGIELVNSHKKSGHTIVLLSSGSEYVVDLMKDFLDVPYAITTKVVVENGFLTDKFEEPLCYREGKKYWAENFAGEMNISLKDSYFYTDSSSDIPFLETVGNPRAVNPDPFLNRYAKKQNWPVLNFKDTYYSIS